ncbi:LAMI_0C11100g1_1 [Lachancea mirantina]|uniref:LAMI_0C11100g1_1 n=1 Tax=Lachancea mirantina TaxID=1230905 RepID=A0A1G4J6M1_9SACH|nr:LAMI_0C11100g1_1 [Lachancea mirantina]
MTILVPWQKHIYTREAAHNMSWSKDAVNEEKVPLSEERLEHPRQIFRNHVHHLWASRKLPVTFLLLHYLGSCSLLSFGFATNSCTFVLLACVGLVTFVGASFLLNPFRSLSVRDKMLLMEEVLKENPRLDREKWEKVAVQSNYAMHEEGSRKNPYFFYDGDECMTFFQHTLLTSFTKEMKIDKNYEPRGDLIEQAARHHLEKLASKYTNMDQA